MLAAVPRRRRTMRSPRIRRRRVLWGCRWSETGPCEVRTARPALALACQAFEAHRTVAFLALRAHRARRGFPSPRWPAPWSTSPVASRSPARADDRPMHCVRARFASMTFARCDGGLPPAPGRHPTRSRASSRRRLAGYDPGESDLEMRFAAGHRRRRAARSRCSSTGSASAARHYRDRSRVPAASSSPSRSTAGSTTRSRSALRRRSGTSERPRRRRLDCAPVHVDHDRCASAVAD